MFVAQDTKYTCICCKYLVYCKWMFTTKGGRFCEGFGFIVPGLYYAE